jgi:uncharacterized alkaline shock family protein YloU
MAAKTDKKTTPVAPVNKDDLTPSSNITYNNEVVAIIAGLAANEVEGIAGMCNVSGSLISKNRNVTKGVKVEVGTEEVAVDLYVIMEYGIPIQRAAADAQENVRKAIESMTGLHVVRVDVHVQSVSFEQEKKALQAGAQNAALAAGETEPEPAKLTENKAPKAEEKKQPEKQEPAKPAEKEEPKAAEPAAEEPKAGEPAPVPVEDSQKDPKPKAESKPRGRNVKAEKKAAPAAKNPKTGDKKTGGDPAPET